MLAQHTARRVRDAGRDWQRQLRASAAAHAYGKLMTKAKVLSAFTALDERASPGLNRVTLHQWQKWFFKANRPESLVWQARAAMKTG